MKYLRLKKNLSASEHRLLPGDDADANSMSKKAADRNRIAIGKKGSGKIDCRTHVTSIQSVAKRKNSNRDDAATPGI